MAPPRRPVIEELINAAQTGMLDISQLRTASVDEVMSAYLTMASNAVTYAAEHGGNMHVLRMALMNILMRCADPDARAN